MKKLFNLDKTRKKMLQLSKKIHKKVENHDNLKLLLLR